MAAISTDRFLQIVRKSQLVSDDDLTRFLTEGSLGSGPERTAESIADRMVAHRLVNRWQADNLLQGKYKGFTLGKYMLLGHLGTGGMSSVYLAEHPVMERLVAIKVLPRKYIENPNYLDRFRREARAVAALDHPNIVRAFDIDQDGDTHYIVMEYVDGRDLQQTVRQEGPLDPHQAADYIAQAAMGLQHAHEAGLIHRDVKPANCLVDKRGVVKLLDLGLAKFSEDNRPGLSEIYDDSVVGTADYLAPEQAVNSQLVDSRADIYSLGCTLYFLLTGQPPFPEGSIATRLLKHQTAEPTSITKLRSDVPFFLVDLCRRMMIKSRDERIQTTAQVSEELSQWLASRGKQSSYLRSQGSAAGQSTRTTPFGRGASTVAEPLPPPRELPPGRRSAGETVPTSRGDTRRLNAGDSSVNDNLTLAPLEEEAPKGPSRSDSGDKSDAGSRPERSSASTPKLDAHATGERPSSSSVIDRATISKYESGPLDSLLKDAQFRRSATLPRKQLPSKHVEPRSRGPLIMLITILTLFGVAILITIGVLIWTSI